MDLDLDLDLTPTPSISPDDTEADTPPHTHTGRSYRRRPPPPLAVAYKECMKNHAARIGGRAVDGCGEYMPSASPASLACAACGCHRNFHRRQPDYPTAVITPPFLDFRPPPQPKRASSSLSPTAETPGGRKRFRTKFSQKQKEEMQCFSEKIGWKLQKSNEAAAVELCHEIGVSKGVLKVWMHNNKNSFCNKGRLMSLESSINGGIKNKGIRNESDGGSHFQKESGDTLNYFHHSNYPSSSSP